MKKLLLGIFGLFFGLSSFCSADLVQCADEDWCPVDFSSCVDSITIILSGDYSDPLYIYPYQDEYSVYTEIESYSNTPITFDNYSCGFFIYNNKGVTINVNWSEYVAPVPEITVFYDYGHSSTTITCNGDNSIFINGMSSYSGVTFTPFFNINYIDEDNQNIIESYNKDLLYLSGGQYHKTYTGDNLRVLNLVGGSSINTGTDIIFTGENLPVEITESTGSVFSNFGDNALYLITSNIPSIIAGLFILGAILFLFKLLTPNRRR